VSEANFTGCAVRTGLVFCSRNLSGAGGDKMKKIISTILFMIIFLASAVAERVGDRARLVEIKPSKIILIPWHNGYQIKKWRYHFYDYLWLSDNENKLLIIFGGG
jgi:hypothetical protein